MNISKDSVVAIHYELTNDAGQIIDNSERGEPLKYLHGAGNIIPGLEEALEGKSVGDKLTVNVAPEKAYGPHNPQMVQKVPMSQFQGVDEVAAGMQFQVQDEQGNPIIFTVKSVENDEVTVDANHPLAGQELTFDVEIMEVREATKEEIAHGHVH